MTTLLLTTLLSACNKSSNSNDVSDSVDSTPVISSSNIADSTENVAINSQISVTFSETMDSSTITNLSFNVATGDETPIVAAVSLDNASNTAILIPTSDFNAATVYTATVTSAVQSALGVSLASDHIWSFTTAAAFDTTSPTVSSTYPLDTAIDVALNRNLTVEMSEALDPSSVSITSFTLTNGTVMITGNINSYSGTTLTFNPETT